MALLDSVTPYCTVAEADAILGVTEPWIGATTEQKEAALRQGRMYIDMTYNCAWNERDGTPDNLKEANAILGNEHLKQSLWERQDNLAPVQSKSVQAGSVSSSTTYAEHGGSRWVDPFPDVTALLSYNGLCYITKGGSVGTATVVRR